MTTEVPSVGGITAIKAIPGQEQHSFLIASRNPESNALVRIAYVADSDAFDATTRPLDCGPVVELDVNEAGFVSYVHQNASGSRTCASVRPLDLVGDPTTFEFDSPVVRTRLERTSAPSSISLHRDGTIRRFDWESRSATETWRMPETATSLSLDPHRSGRVVVGTPHGIHTMDPRAPESSTIINFNDDVVHVDHNPNRPNFVCATSNRSVRFVDLRKGSTVKTITHTSPLVENIATIYNPFHDQLVLGVSGAYTELYRVASASSTRAATGDQDHVVRRDFQRPNREIVDSCWSAATPWAYAVAEYGGRITLENVPTAEKYRILL